ncbi:2-amino-4-hydroxy-6-hydroxymethyldihydropteridine diphosphokinase [Draconibacterium halophilum]|uniref:2-amino-4-hydroxy-6-hydroxymethyldihydropteridine pyrophosphokinase n=1 Tax=Draconibacterium halophilum TaxID=2706887 RepID=A0A6C0RAU9_9BACT|nr:2-amino-4-hydroxy-6-hydroxymethyldihydropteridine diphosphokinase [Draconibacterium halophilum]QIA07136.1 2-amino-4-hydroxy-6-hydroxymethyldihydropteridine diphosphokinase [Draconibacterium halophilum]
MNKVFLGIGGNIGDKRQNFIHVLNLIEIKLGKIIQKSSVYETPPWGFRSEDAFWNQVLIIETKLEAEELLWRIREIETDFGRERGNERYSSREMDIDILYFNDDFLESKDLIIPHPRIHERRFVLIPLVEIAPEMKHPLRRLTSIEMLENCLDQSVIKKIEMG